MREIQARVYLPHVAPEVADLVETGFLKPCIFDLKDGVYTKEFAKKVQTLPRFELSARPLEIPPALLALSPDSEVIFRCNESDTVKPAWLVLAIFRGKMERQAKGLFDISEAAKILSESCAGANGQAIPHEHFANDMREAFFSGTLAFFNERLTLMNPKNEDESLIFGSYGETTTPQAINAWLESTGSPHRFPEAVGTPAPLVDAAPAPQASPEPVQAAPAGRARVKGWRQLALPYMAKIWRSDRFGTVKAYCKAIEDRAGEHDSPFVKIRGGLVLKETGKPLSWKTIENSKGEIMAAAASLETP